MAKGFDFAKLIRDVPDFPKPGIIFKDITPLLKDPKGFRAVIDRLVEEYRGANLRGILGIEARGFILAGALAHQLGVSCLPARKPGKLPYRTRKVAYELEYGQASLELHEDAISKGDRILVLDDVLATGGTAAAACSLAEQSGGVVIGCAFLIELSFLEGRKKLANREVFALLKY
jgi:adenine phosphoribosyltransferase